MIDVATVFLGIVFILAIAACIALPILILWWMYDTHKAVREILEKLRSRHRGEGEEEVV